MWCARFIILHGGEDLVKGFQGQIDRQNESKRVGDGKQTAIKIGLKN